VGWVDPQFGLVWVVLGRVGSVVGPKFLLSVGWVGS